jgi:preprotein translocase subunit SecD
MNRYPIWKYLTILLALAIGLIYALPNLYGEAPAVQISAAKATTKVEATLLQRVEGILVQHQLRSTGIFFDRHGPSATIKVRLPDTETQLKAKDALDAALNEDRSSPTYTVALNLLSASPSSLTKLHALPMYLGLDLRGGVHFLLQVDLAGALGKRLDSLANDVRSLLREKKIRHNGVSKSGQSLVLHFTSQSAAQDALAILRENTAELRWDESPSANTAGSSLIGQFIDSARQEIQDSALKQNIATLLLNQGFSYA